MRKFTLFIAFIVFASFVFGQSVNKPCFTKGEAKAVKDFSTFKSKPHKTHAAKPTTLIWSDDFSTTTNWTLSHASGTTDDWQLVTSNSTSMTSADLRAYMGGWARGKGRVAVCDGWTALHGAGGTGTIPIIDAYCETTSPINLTGYSAVAIKFLQHYLAFNSDTTFVQFSTDGGSTWPFTISVNPKNQVAVNTWAPDSISLVVSQYIANESNVKIRFHFLTTSTSGQYGGGYGWGIDDVQLVQPNTNNLEITSILPSFDNPYAGATSYFFVEGTYKYFPASCPTRILNAAIIKNTGSANQTNTMLNIAITDPIGGNYSENSGLGHTINSGVVNDTLTVGYTMSAGTATYTNPFYLNCLTGFTPPVGGLTHINNQPYQINYQITSDAITTPTPTTVDSFAFYVGYPGNPYAGGPDLQYSFARSNQDTACDPVAPQSWSSGGTDGDGLYTSFAIQDAGGSTCVNYMNIFIHRDCTFDATSHIGSSIQGYIYTYDQNSSTWISQISTNQYDLTTADVGKWKQLDFLVDGSAEYLSQGVYLVGVEITYNSFVCRFGEDNSSIQHWAATFWKFAGGTSQDPAPIINYHATPMINLTQYSNPLAIKRINDNNIVKVFPNPTNGLVTIAAPENSSIQIYNLLGINVASVEHSSAFNKIDLSNLSNGNYIVKVINGNKVITKKFNLIK